MKQLVCQLQIHTQVVWGVSDEEIADEIARAEKHGWAWDGQVWWKHTVNSRTCVAVLTSVASHRPEADNPRLTLTRI